MEGERGRGRGREGGTAKARERERGIEEGGREVVLPLICSMNHPFPNTASKIQTDF